MRYLEIKAGPWPSNDELPWWTRPLSRILPSSNPDLEPYYESATSWWLEINEKGEPVREIGFSASGEALVLAPVEGNFGMMLDASDDWSGSDKDSKDAAENFEVVWKSLWPRFKKIDEDNRMCR